MEKLTEYHISIGQELIAAKDRVRSVKDIFSETILSFSLIAVYDLYGFYDTIAEDNKLDKAYEDGGSPKIL